MDLTVTGAERIPLRVPFRKGCRDWMEIDHGSMSEFDVIRVTTSDSQIVGYGEAFTHYGGQGPSDATLARMVGRNPAELALDHSLGKGAQIALLDVLGQHLEVPLWQLLRPEAVRTECAISWWSSGLVPQDAFAVEAQSALAEGYLTQKIKARPWNNVVDVVQSVSAVTPPDYRLDLDWNGMLQTRGEAAEVLGRLDAFERVGIYESPIRLEDIDGMALLRRQVARPLAEHFRAAYYRRLIKADAVDGFVLSEGGALGMLRDGDIAYALDKSSWLQVLGTGITTAFASHLAAVSPGSRWPMVTCMNIYEDDLLEKPLIIAGGNVAVPTGPGLGVTVDQDALERYRVRQEHAPMTNRKLLIVELAGGERMYCDSGSLWRDARDQGWSVVQPSHARLRIRDDDGSADFDTDYTNAARRFGTE